MIVRACICLTAILALALPAGADAQQTVTGTLVELHGHRADGSEVDESYAIVAGSRERPLADSQPRSLVGRRVRLTDTAPAAGLQGRAQAADAQRLAPAPPPGPQSLLVILLTTPDAQQASATPDEARSAVFTGPQSSSVLYEQQSEGTTHIGGLLRSDGDVAGPLRIPVPVGGCDFWSIADSADDAARAAGWAVEAYDHVLYALPGNADCAWGGLGEMPGRRTWVNGSLDTRVVAHELGHNLGAHHANSYACTSGGAPVALSGTCTTSEYGDPFDVMGLDAHLMSSWHRAQVGELPAAQQLSLRHSQTVTLASADTFGSGEPRLVLVPRKDPGAGVTSWIALELRSPLAPFDAWAGEPVTSGITARLVPDLTSSTQTQLLDASPDTATIADASLQPGMVLRDDAHDITITAGAVNGTTATATVTMPTLGDLPPSVPGDLRAGGDTNGVTLSWSASSDDVAVDHYEVLRGDDVVGTTSALSFGDARVSTLTSATYRVVAVDRDTNRSGAATAQISLADATPPSAVPGLDVSTSDGRVTLTWSPAQDNRGLRGYRVVRDAHVLGDVMRTSYLDDPPAGHHRYEVSAIDTAGNRGPAAVADAFLSGGTGPALRLVLVSRRWHGRVVTMRFRAAKAQSMRAYRGHRLVASASGSRLTVRLRFPGGARRRSVRIVAASATTTTTSTWTVRR